MTKLFKYVFFVLVLNFLFFSSDAFAKKVAVVLSSEHKIYEKIYEIFRNQPEMQDVVVKKFVLGRDNERYIVDLLKEGGFDAAFSVGTKSTKLLKKIGTIPTIYSMVVNPKYFGFLGKDETSLENLTGISIEVPVDKQFSLLKQIMPTVRRVGIVYNPEKSGYTIARALKVAEKYGLEIREIPVRNSQQVMKALAKLEGHIDVLFAIIDDTVYKSGTIGHILLWCLKKKIPVFGFSHSLTKAGAIFSTYIDYDSIGVIAAKKIKLILDGTPCKEIPFQFTNRWKYSVNLTVARRLGISIPKNVILHADKVVND